MDKILAAWDAFVRLIRPDVDAIIAHFVKAQSKLEALIKREESKLEAETVAIAALVKSRLERNTVVNRAYRIIHNLDQLTA